LSFPCHELPGDFFVVKAFVQIEWHGGYLSHLNLPRQQVQALAPGSTFLARSSSPVDLAEIESRSYGLRTEEGFGRVMARNADWESDATEWERIRPPMSAKTVVLSPVPAGSDARRLAVDLLQQKVREGVRTRAASVAMQARNLPRPHLLHRLAVIVESGPEGTGVLRLALKNLRRTASRQIEACRVEGKPLGDYLVGAIDDPESVLNEIVHVSLGDRRSDWETVLKEQPAALLSRDLAFRDEVVRVFLIRLLQQLARRSKSDVER
jgi:hypothetical protein